MEKNTVELYVYDLSMGMAKTLAPMFIGKSLEGIWHTSIFVFGREFVFNSSGVEISNPGSSRLGPPVDKVTLGETEVPFSVFSDYIKTLTETSFAGPTYNIFHHNCNNFSEEVAQFLVGVSIPKYILDLPKEVLSSNLQPELAKLLNQFERGSHIAASPQISTNRERSPDYDQLNTQVEEARYNSFLLDQRRKRLLKKERKREKRRKKILAEGGEIEDSTMAEADTVNGTNTQLPSEEALAIEEEERREDEEKKKSREPPIVYKDLIDVKAEFDALIGLIDGKLSPEEQQSAEEMSLYMLGDEGSWALSDGFLNFIGRLLHDKALPDEVRVRTINILAAAALKDDVILLLHQDRKDHVLMNYAFGIDRLSIEEQQAVALFVANMFENLSSSEWLLYISEWTHLNQQTSNIRVTTKVAVHSLLADIPELQERGAAIIHNLACKEVKTVVFDDVAVELTMALLQYFNSDPSEEQLYRCLKALARFTQISNQEVPQLVQMIGPHPNTFKGKSPRIDELITQISAKLR